MFEFERVFEDRKTDVTFKFGELRSLYREKTNKKSLTAFYDFLREAIDLNYIEKTNSKYLVRIEKFRGSNEEQKH